MMETSGLVDRFFRSIVVFLLFECTSFTHAHSYDLLNYWKIDYLFTCGICI